MNPPFAPERIVVDNQLAEGERLVYEGDQLIIEERQIETEDGQIYGSSMVDARKGGVGPTFLRAMPHATRNDGFDIVRAAALAEPIGARIYSLELSGVNQVADTHDPRLRQPDTRLSREQLREAFKGNLLPIVVPQLRAFYQEFKLSKETPINLIGASLGTWVALWWAEAFANGRLDFSPRIESLHMQEPVASGGRIGVRGLARIAGGLTADAKSLPLYMHENSQAAPAAAVPFQHISPLHSRAHKGMGMRQAHAIWSVALGVRAGLPDLARSVLKDTQSPSDIRHAQFTVAQFEGSNVSTIEDGAILTHTIREAGADDVRHYQLSAREGDRTHLGHGTSDAHVRQTRYSRAVLTARARQELATYFESREPEPSSEELAA